MEAFEKWRGKQEAEGIEQGFRYGNRVGWRAALERALKAGRDAGLEYHISVSWIKKELETEK